MNSIWYKLFFEVKVDWKTEIEAVKNICFFEDKYFRQICFFLDHQIVIFKYYFSLTNDLRKGFGQLY